MSKTCKRCGRLMNEKFDSDMEDKLWDMLRDELNKLAKRHRLEAELWDDFSGELYNPEKKEPDTGEIMSGLVFEYSDGELTVSQENDYENYKLKSESDLPKVMKKVVKEIKDRLL